MFKKLIILSIFLAVTSTAHAEPINLTNVFNTVKQLPVKQGFVYSIKDSEFAHVSTAILFERGDFGVEAGYMDTGKLVGAVSYKLIDFKDFVEMPIVEKLEFRPGIYVGADQLDRDSQFDFGVSLTIATIRW